MRLGSALVLSAPSGAGKTTLVHKLLEEFPNFGFSISYTTRPPRKGEVNGRDYHFVSMDEFVYMRQEGVFAEWAEVHGNYYATPLEPLKEMFQKGQDVILDIDVQGAGQLKLTLQHALFIFVLPPSMQELEKRLRSRGSDSESIIQTRLLNAKKEIEAARWFDSVVVNDDLNRAYEDLKALYIASTLSTNLHRYQIDSLLA